MPAYNREAICQFCNTKIIPPKKGLLQYGLYMKQTIKKLKNASIKNKQ